MANITLQSSNFGFLADISYIQYSNTTSGYSDRCIRIQYISSTQVICTLNSTVPPSTILSFQVYTSAGVPTQFIPNPVQVLSNAAIISSSSSSSGVSSSSSSSSIVSSTGVSSSSSFHLPFLTSSFLFLLPPTSGNSTIVQDPLGQIYNTSVDPCTTIHNPCRNGATCIYTPYNNITQTGNTLACQCFPGFFGPYCNVGFLGCENCVLTPEGGGNVTLIGLGLQFVHGIHLFGEDVDFTFGNTSTDDPGIQIMIATWAHVLTSYPSFVQYISFEAPPRGGNNHTNFTATSRRLLSTTFITNQTYPPIQITVVINNYEFSYLLRNLLMYASNNCTAYGYYWSQRYQRCLPCPSSGAVW